MRFLRTLSLAMLLVFSSAVYSQTSVTAIALFKDRAMLSVDGTKSKIVRAGSKYKGVTLISSNTAEAVVEVAGRRETLTLNGTAQLSSDLSATSKEGNAVVEIRVNEEGFFESLGLVNGRQINFLVDTGASLVVLSSDQADAIGLSYTDGVLGVASTASGNAPMYNIKIDNMSLGGIRVQDVNAGVIQGSFPQKPLLGMTFLSKVDMTREGNLMTLKQR